MAAGLEEPSSMAIPEVASSTDFLEVPSWATQRSLVSHLHQASWVAAIAFAFVRGRLAGQLEPSLASRSCTEGAFVAAWEEDQHLEQLAYCPS